MNNKGHIVRFFTLIIAFAMASILLTALANELNSVSAQDIERSLDIERYENEPYEIVDVYAGGKSIKDKIKSKIKYGKEGLDNAKFKDKDGWFKYIKVRVRNISNHPIISISATLRLEHLSLPQGFGLPISSTRNLNQEPLKPGEEIDLQVSENHINPTKKFLLEKGADENAPSVRLTIDHVFFTKTYQWSKGGFLQPDPNNPNKWNTISPPTTPEIRQNSQSSNFISSVIKPASYSMLMDEPGPSRCRQPVEANYTATHCPEAVYLNCYQLQYLYTDPGRFTREAMPRAL